MPAPPMLPMIADGDFDFFWAIALMMIFAFSQWIRRMSQSAGDQDRVEPQFPPRTREPQGNAGHGTGPNEELRRLLESVLEQQAPPASRRQKNPPPPPIVAKPVVVDPPVPKPVPATKRPAVPAKRSSTPLRITPQSIRDAVVLKEILDPPPGLRDDW